MALLALGVLTLLDLPLILVVFMALPMDRVLHVVVDMTVVVVPSLPRIMVAVRRRLTGERVLREGLLLVPQDRAVVAVPGLPRLLPLIVAGVVLALRLVETGVEQVAREEGYGVELSGREVNAVITAGPEIVVTASVEVVVAASSAGIV